MAPFRFSLGSSRPEYRSALEIHGIPERDGGHNQVQPTGPVTLVLKRTITNSPSRLKKTARVSDIASLRRISEAVTPALLNGSYQPQDFTRFPLSTSCRPAEETFIIVTDDQLFYLPFLSFICP